MMSMLETFSLDAVPTLERPAALQHVFARYATPLTLRIRETGAVGARFSAAGPQHARMERFDIRGVSGVATRSGSGADSAIERTLTLHHVDVGSIDLRHGARRARLTSGATVLSDSALPLGMAQRGRCGMTTLTIPIDRLRVPDTAVTAALSVPLGNELPMVSTITTTLHRIASDASRFPEAPWRLLETSLIELMRALVLIGSGDARAAREPLGESLAERVVGYLERHVLDPGLNAERIAAVHGISVRYLYVVLQRRGITLGDWIRTARLEHASRILRNEVSVTVADVAYRCGFADHAHFARTFRRRWGMTPSEWRAQPSR
jgi:AraC-like DNA-binding protein